MAISGVRVVITVADAGAAYSYKDLAGTRITDLDLFDDCRLSLFVDDSCKRVGWHLVNLPDVEKGLSCDR